MSFGVRYTAGSGVTTEAGVPADRLRLLATARGYVRGVTASPPPLRDEHTGLGMWESVAVEEQDEDEDEEEHEDENPSAAAPAPVRTPASGGHEYEGVRLSAPVLVDVDPADEALAGGRAVSFRRKRPRGARHDHVEAKVAPAPAPAPTAAAAPAPAAAAVPPAKLSFSLSRKGKKARGR